LNLTFLLLCRDSFLGPMGFLLFTWNSDTHHVGLRDLDLGGFICRFVCSPTMLTLGENGRTVGPQDDVG